ncbi:Uncharacterised protein [Paucimonas lemoignei]|nr:Uncharacterised protein [Paucimonas lemoignei]
MALLCQQRSRKLVVYYLVVELFARDIPRIMRPA